MTQTKSELLARIDENHKHHPSPDQARIDAHQRVRHLTAVCAKELVKVCPIGRELSLALTSMEEAMMWANAAIARSYDESIQ